MEVASEQVLGEIHGIGVHLEVHYGIYNLRLRAFNLNDFENSYFHSSHTLRFDEDIVKKILITSNRITLLQSTVPSPPLRAPLISKILPHIDRRRRRRAALPTRSARNNRSKNDISQQRPGSSRPAITATLAPTPHSLH